MEPPPSDANNLLNDLLNALTGGVIGNSHGIYNTTDNDPNTVLSSDLGQFFTNKENTNYTTAAPKAFLNYVAFDDQMNMNSGNSGVVQVPTITGSEQAQALVAPEQIIQRNGYLYIYVSNESAQKVFFDNLVIHHNKGHLLEEDQYYPFGLQMAGISDKALPNIPNNYLYNGKELQQNEFSDGTGLEGYDYGFRGYDPQIARFTEQDPLTDELATVSPYQYALNDPVANIDEDGLSPFNLLCPGTSGFTIFLKDLGEGFTHIASSPVARAVSITATMTKTAAVVSNALAVEGEINNTFSAPEVGGVGNAGGMGTPGSDLEGANSENIGQNNGGPGHPFLLPIIPFKVMVTEGKWAARVIGEFIDPIVQSAKTLFKGTKPNGSKASTFQRVNAGIDFVAQTATLGGKGESDAEIGEMGEEPRVKDGNDVGELNNSKWFDENGNTIWPKNNGFEGTPEKSTLSKGTQFDRYGYSNGSFASPKGTTFSERSLPLSSYLKPLTTYEVIKPVDVLSGKVAPWFGEPGGGVQYKFSTSIQQLIQEGYIKEIK